MTGREDVSEPELPFEAEPACSCGASSIKYTGHGRVCGACGRPISPPKPISLLRQMPVLFKAWAVQNPSGYWQHSLYPNKTDPVITPEHRLVEVEIVPVGTTRKLQDQIEDLKANQQPIKPTVVSLVHREFPHATDAVMVFKGLVHVKSGLHLNWPETMKAEYDWYAPQLKDLHAARDLNQYKVVCDDSNNPPTYKDNHPYPLVSLYLQLYKHLAVVEISVENGERYNMKAVVDAIYSSIDVSKYSYIKMKLITD